MALLPLPGTTRSCRALARHPAPCRVEPWTRLDAVASPDSIILV
jgi:hypothetical protein